MDVLEVEGFETKRKRILGAVKSLEKFAGQLLHSSSPNYKHSTPILPYPNIIYPNYHIPLTPITSIIFTPITTFPQLPHSPYPNIIYPNYHIINYFNPNYHIPLTPITTLSIILT
ncbi:hypothetical protein GBAR_LOCUS18442, partial [Geodia barretti]